MSRFIRNTLIIFSLAAIALYVRIFMFTTPGVVNAEAVFLPVGQGDSELVRVGRVTMLIDAGPGQSVNRLLDGVIGIGKRIDIVLVSHGDSDHVSGLSGVLASREVGVIAYSGTSTPLLNELFAQARVRRVPIIPLTAGSSIAYGSSTIEILWPTANADIVSRNDTSLVIALRSNGDCALFTGDIDSKTESDLVAYYGEKINCDVLKIAHHGSKYSSSAQFLQAVSPAVSVIEVGKNSYGHPAPETLARITQAGSETWRTDTDGIVRIVFGMRKLNVYTIGF